EELHHVEYGRRADDPGGVESLELLRQAHPLVARGQADERHGRTEADPPGQGETQRPPEGDEQAHDLRGTDYDRTGNAGERAWRSAEPRERPGFRGSPAASPRSARGPRR